jgi:hypothetical protein
LELDLGPVFASGQLALAGPTQAREKEKKEMGQGKEELGWERKS